MHSSPRERIDRMEAEGLISPEQAEMLRASISVGPTIAPAAALAPVRRSSALYLLLVVAGAIAVTGLIAFALGTGTEAIQDVTRSLNEPEGHGAMNKTLSTFLAIAMLLILPIAIWVWLHNAMVGKEEAVFEAWAQTESNLQRRADLVPALVETVSRYLRHETETLQGVTAARGQAAEQLGAAIEKLIRVDKEMSDHLRALSRDALGEESALGALFAAQTQVGRGIGGVLAVVEDYPELRSADQFLELQAQLEGTENRINVARIRFNEAVAKYNAAIRRLPGTLVASVGGFRRKAYFRSEEEARNAPELAFD